jgi:hypothetical protein
MESNKTDEMLKKMALEKMGQAFSLKSLNNLIAIGDLFKKANINGEKALEYLKENFNSIARVLPKFK